MDGQLHTAMKAVGQAIKLDGDGENREAYFRYLSCIKFISQVVLEDSKNQGYQGPIKTKSTVRMLKLAQQCMDRVTAIVDNTEEGEAAHLAPPPDDQSGRFSPSICSFNSTPLPANQVEYSKPIPRTYKPPPALGSVSQHAEQSSRTSRGATTSTTSLPVPVGYRRPLVARKDKLTPLEAAYLENQRLMNSYRARLLKMMGNSKGKGQVNKTTLNLTLQRRLMENMAIARAREAALAKKIHERHQRLQEEAARRFSTTGEPTRAEIELRQIYASVMEFENNEDWLSEWRRKLRETPKDLQFIHALIGHILACPDHPFTQLLKKFQYTVYQSLLPLVQKDAEELEQIKVPYKKVEPLLLAGSKPRVIPPNGFDTPGDLEEESLDEDLIRRLQALRNSSHDECRESLYGDMLASSSSLGEDEEDDMWDSGDETLEDGSSVEREETGDGSEIAENSEIASIKSQVSIEVEHCDGSETPQSICHGDKERNNDEAGDALSMSPMHPVGESGDHQGEGSFKREESEICRAEHEENDEVSGEEDDVINQMKSINAEVREGLQEALLEGEKLEKSLDKPITEDFVEGSIVQNGVTHNLNGEINNEPQGIPVENIDNGDDDGRLETLSRHDEIEAEGGGGVLELEDTHDHNHRSGSIPGSKCGTQSDSEQAQVSTADEEDASKENDVFDEVTSADSPVPDDESGRHAGEDERLDMEQKKEKTKEEEEQERISRLQEDALQRHLKHISKDIQSYLDKLQALLVAIYEDLDSAVAKEQCIAVIEKHFFQLIWQPLLTLYRRANLRKEITAATAMTKYHNALPENIGIIKKLCLGSDDEDAIQDDSHYPYQLAVEELRRISGYFSPLEKLECVVKASRAIITCVGDYYEAQGKSRENTENAVGCDDLLPILSFVVIKSALPHLVSECSIMEEFIHEGYLFGEEGYCLTTLQTSLGYVLKLAED